MMRKAREKILTLLGLTFISIILPDITLPAVAGERNILLITIDTLRWDRLSIYCNKYVRTPYIDELTRKSTTFLNAYAHNPLTRPSHTNILTGLSPLYHGISDNPGFRLDERYLTLAEYLKKFGYKTAAFIGAFVLDSRFGLDQGFDVYNDSMDEQDIFQLDFVERKAEEVIKPAIQWLGEVKKKWFCWVHLFDPHVPYEPPEPYRHLYPHDLYSGEVAYVDAQLGYLFSFLKMKGLMENTIIILTSDHGEALGEKGERQHGFFAYNNTLRVPLVLYIPGTPPGVVETNACHLDLFPTVCDILGLPLPAPLQGESLLPFLEGKERQKKLIYFESMAPHFSLAAAPLTGFIEDNLKFIDLPLKEVYDLKADPNEEVDISFTSNLTNLMKKLESLKKSLKAPDTRPNPRSNKEAIRPLLESLGYVSSQPSENKTWGVKDDPKALMPLIAQTRMALEEFKAGKKEAALKKLNNIILIRPNYISAICNLASAYFLLGQREEALATLEKGLDKNPGNLQLTARLGIMLVMSKRFAEAVSPLESACREDETNPDYLNYLGMAYMGTGELERGKEIFKRALQLDPAYAPALNNLGYLNLTYFVQRKEEKYLDLAIDNFNQALKNNPRLEAALRGKELADKYKNEIYKGR